MNALVRGVFASAMEEGRTFCDARLESMCGSTSMCLRFKKCLDFTVQYVSRKTTCLGGPSY